MMGNMLEMIQTHYGDDNDDDEYPWWRWSVASVVALSYTIFLQSHYHVLLYTKKSIK